MKQHLERARRSTLAPAMLGSLILWAALPPLNMWPLGWIAPVPWLLLIRRQELGGWRPYWSLSIAGLTFWLLAIHWLRLPHPAASIGWLALSIYLGFYLPLFVWLSRYAVHRLGQSLVLVAPVVWTGLELTRAHMLSGFLMAALGHTQYRWTGLIQISDLGGGYAVSFLVMLVAACIARAWPGGPSRPAVAWPAAVSAAALVLVLLYGHWRTTGVATKAGPKVAIIQGAIAADWKADKDKARAILSEYLRLSREAIRAADGSVDLIVWPETMFPYQLFLCDPDDPPTPDLQARIRDANDAASETIAGLVRRLRTPLLIGLVAREQSATHFDRFNAAVLANRAGQIAARYDKMHLVLFGEYVPLASLIPALDRLSPLGPSLTPGATPVAMESDGVRFTPSICFETVLPHVIRRQVTRLAEQSEPPDVLVNLTNDGWFWGSSELEMHLACSVFRAVECRRPMLVAANCGISAWIDGDGRVRQRGPRQATDTIVADVRIDPRSSPYVRFVGDWPAGLCLVVCLALTLASLYDHYRSRPGKEGEER
jgi:apolipoprotein N-acyltransferase